MRTCQRCGEQLVNDVAGRSADGRLVCTRATCQFAEEVNQRIAEGTLELLDPETLKVELRFPTVQEVNQRVQT